MMEKVSVSKLVELRRITKEGSKQTFIRNLLKGKVQDPDKIDIGGDYWITSSSAVAATFWNNEKKYLEDKIQDLSNKIELSEFQRTKNQFQENIDLLVIMQDFDFRSILPNTELQKLSVIKNIITISNVPIQVRPQRIFSYSDNGAKQVGGVWFVAKKDGYSDGELGMFCTAIYQYLKIRYGDEYVVDPNFCIAVDISRAKDLSYTEILKNGTSEILLNAINELNKLL
ncbi:hypothetical protein QO206_14010 [Leeuwenhoekiella aequorea]|uniref:hypothetical protein n=1 Tax=Leeuwenhoekiella aequorea TaxID=283736 RepID=UPI00352E9683|tara:strand:+ start:35905 stop:36588 length:684 start_codon:yes stop_codon:yes gene_type:complete